MRPSRFTSEDRKVSIARYLSRSQLIEEQGLLSRSSDPIAGLSPALCCLDGVAGPWGAGQRVSNWSNLRLGVTREKRNSSPGSYGRERSKGGEGEQGMWCRGELRDRCRQP